MTDFVCEVDERYRSACEGLDFYGEYEGKRYCVLHFLGEEKKEDFRKVLESKFAQRDYDFGGTIFPEGTSDFQEFEFKSNVNFARATFVEANFSGAKFGGESAYFMGPVRR